MESIKLELDEERAGFSITRDGKEIPLTPDELRQAADAWEYRWFTEELEYRFDNAEDYELEQAASLIEDGFMDAEAVVEECWQTYYDCGRTDGIDRCIEAGAKDAAFRAAKELWLEFGDVPYDPEGECIEVSWRGFPAGTHRERMWRWFEKRFGVSVARDLMKVA